MKVVSVNVSKSKGTVKEPVESISLDQEGIIEDAHRGKWHRQVSILSREAIEIFEKSAKRKIEPGEFAENLTTEGLDLDSIAILDRITCGTALLEVSQIGKKCHGDTCAIYKEVGNCIMPKQGIFCRVIEPGVIKSNDSLTLKKRELKIKIITLSDRASRGEYKDLSGPAIIDSLNAFFADKRWHQFIDHIIIADDERQFETELTNSIQHDIIITTGGTGIGPRDITPEVITAFIDKEIPGIMENIRIKYGAHKPNALLSRSIAGVRGQTQVYSLPGSVKAVREYMAEVLKTLEHCIYMLHSLDLH